MFRDLGKKTDMADAGDAGDADKSDHDARSGGRIFDGDIDDDKDKDKDKDKDNDDDVDDDVDDNDDDVDDDVDDEVVAGEGTEKRSWDHALNIGKWVDPRKPAMPDRAWLDPVQHPYAGDNKSTIKKDFDKMDLQWLEKREAPKSDKEIQAFKEEQELKKRMEFSWGHDDAVLSVCWSPDDEIMVSGSADGNACVWSARTGDCIHCLGHDSKWVHAVAFSPEGDVLACGLADGGVKLWRTSDFATVGQLRDIHTNWVNDLAFVNSVDGGDVPLLAVTASSDRSLAVWMVRSQYCVLQEFWHSSWITSVSTESERGDLIATGGADSTTRIWRLEPGHKNVQLARLQVLHDHNGWVTAVRWCGESLVTAGKDMKMQVYRKTDLNGPSAAPVSHAQSIDVEQVIMSLSYSPQCLLVTAGEHSTILFWDLRSGSVKPLTVGMRQRRLVGHGGTVYAAAWSHDSKFVLSGSEDTTARVWNRLTSVCLRKLEHREDDSWKSKVR